MKFTIDQKNIRAMLNFAAIKDIRYYLMGLHFIQDARGTIIEATDGHVCGRLLIDSTPQEPAKVIIGTPELKQILGTKAKANHAIDFEVINGYVTMKSAGVTVTIGVMDAVFPDCARVTPKAGYEIVASHYDPELLIRFAKAEIDFGARKTSTYLRQNGENPALVTMLNVPEFVGVIMPMRGAVIAPDVPAWVSK